MRAGNCALTMVLTLGPVVQAHEGTAAHVVVLALEEGPNRCAANLSTQRRFGLLPPAMPGPAWAGPG